MNRVVFAQFFPKGVGVVINEKARITQRCIGVTVVH
jgi:hypothetical protein